ncbi:MAG TPA: hypothetical protein VIS29_11080, partial [Streptomyces sp.]
MFWVSAGSVVLGLVLARLALRVLSGRLPYRRTVFVSGALGALFGAALTHSALGSGGVLPTLTGAVLVSAVALSLLIRPRRGGPV